MGNSAEFTVLLFLAFYFQPAFTRTIAAANADSPSFRYYPHSAEGVDNIWQEVNPLYLSNSRFSVYLPLRAFSSGVMIALMVIFFFFAVFRTRSLVYLPLPRGDG